MSIADETIFITGTTGYLGSYVATGLLRDTKHRLALLVRADSQEAGVRRLWKAWQLHISFDEFLPLVCERVDIYLGDLTRPKLGLPDTEYERLARSMDSVIHIAASLNRKSAKSCFNVNLRGTLAVAKLARKAQDAHGLRRFSDVSTTAVAGVRQGDLVVAEEMVQWDRSDWDPYARTKKFCETMVEELLPDVDVRVFRPSTVLGDSRFPETTQFDMVRAFVFLASLPVLPLRPQWRHDIVPADYVAKGIQVVHVTAEPKHHSYNLSSGSASETYATITDALVRAEVGPKPLFAPPLQAPFASTVRWLANTPRKWGIARHASLMQVFWPYIVYDTVFDNSNIVDELGYEPAVFSEYADGLFRFATGAHFKYPYIPWPEGVDAIAEVA